MGEPAPSERPHLVAIDDDETNLALIVSVLSAYDVTTFAGPVEALRAAQDGLRPDLIVCDVTMPAMTGFELHARLREIPAVRGVPFIYLTALDSADDVRTGMGLGADDYLTKPYTPAELRAAVASRLERATALRADEDASWHVVTLGGLDVRVGDRRLAWASRRSFELFLRLLEAGADGVHDDAVRHDLWTHAPTGNQLHALVSRLRGDLGEAAGVEHADDRLRLVGLGPTRWDVPVFERAAAEALAGPTPAALATALASYGGTFLPGSDGPWVDETRGRLDATAIELMETAVEVSEGSERDLAERRLEAFLEGE